MAQLHVAAVTALLARHREVVTTIGGATRQERAPWIALARQHAQPVRLIRLIIAPATAIRRAQCDSARPRSSRAHWPEIVQHWYQRFEAVDALAEGIACYEEVLVDG